MNSSSRVSSVTLHLPRPKWFTRLGAGIRQDIRARAPWYVSDWADAWNYRVVPATALVFFANVLPGIAFSLDIIETTKQYGVAEVLVASFMAAFIFSVLGAQPLTIAGVTGPITVFNKTIFNLLRTARNPPVYLHFIGWVYLWSAVFHWVTAMLNWCNFLKYVTIFSCDTFGFYVSWVYLQYGVQVITRQFTASDELGPLVSILLALLMLVTCVLFQTLANSVYFHRHVRRFLADYGMPISLVAASAMAHWGRFRTANPTTLPVGGAFQAAGGRDWLVRFWQLEARWVGIAFPFGFVLWILFFFDHNVSSLMAQGRQFPLKKPPGFHYDFFILGICTFIAGLIGVPAPNGLIPQAPIHTTSLLVMGHPDKKAESKEQVAISTEEKDGTPTCGLPGPTNTNHQEVSVGVVEQRVSNLVQGALCLALLTDPFLHVLHMIPRGVLAGLFWYMGADALRSNGITNKLLYLLQDKHLTVPNFPLLQVRKSRIILFVVIQLVAFGATFVITQTIGTHLLALNKSPVTGFSAAIVFPVVIMSLIPVRILVIPRLPFTDEELAILDRPTASLFTMESVGGSL